MREWNKVLLVGWGDDAGVTHYRTKLPARMLGAEWVTIGMDGEPIAGDGDRTDHDVIIVQSCWEPWQLQAIDRMRRGGAVVLANVDDWLPAIVKLGARRHQFSEHFAGKRERNWLEMLRRVDGAIVSTPWLQERVQAIMPGRPVALARNPIDLRRYDHWRGKGTRKPGRTVIGWAGGTGHAGALDRILDQLHQTMREHDDVDLLLVGDRTAAMFTPEELDGRVYVVEWQDMEFYPVHIDAMDIVIAPAEENDFYRGKSQLRFYEAAAMGKPVIGDPMVYSEIVDKRTGLHAVPDWHSNLKVLINNPSLREVLGANARRFVERDVSDQSDARKIEWMNAVELCAPMLVA